MNGWLLDTNVVSELRKSHPDRRVKAWSDTQAPSALFLSTMTFAEIRYGIELQSDHRFQVELTTWLDEALRPWFAGRILPVDEDVILEWRRMVAYGRKRGITFHQPDLFIAATARIHDLAVCTRDEDHFRKARVPVFNPWTAS